MSAHSVLVLEHQLLDTDVCILLRSSASSFLALSVPLQEACDTRKDPWILWAKSGPEKQPFELSTLSLLILESGREATKKCRTTESEMKTANSYVWSQGTSNLSLRQRGPLHTLSIAFILSDGKLQETCLKIHPANWMIVLWDRPCEMNTTVLKCFEVLIGMNTLPGQVGNNLQSFWI